MTFNLDHWRNPRKTIATKFHQNDIAYATHGAIMAMEALRIIDKPLSELRKLSLLDYGAGTGRVARVLSKGFSKVYAYDPVKECIDMAYTECNGIIFNNLEYFYDIKAVPKADMAVCINVIEHLTDVDAAVLVKNLSEKVAGPTYLWYSSSKNKRFMQNYLTKEQQDEDNSIDTSRIIIREFHFGS